MSRRDTYITLAKNLGAKYVLVMCDDFDGDNIYYPVYCYTENEYNEKI